MQEALKEKWDTAEYQRRLQTWIARETRLLGENVMQFATRLCKLCAALSDAAQAAELIHEWFLYGIGGHIGEELIKHY